MLGLCSCPCVPFLTFSCFHTNDARFPQLTLMCSHCNAVFSTCDFPSGEMDPKERLARQRKLLQKKLGLDMGAAIGMNTDDLFNDEDLDYACQTSGPRSQGSKAAAGSSSRNNMVGHI